MAVMAAAMSDSNVMLNLASDGSCSCAKPKKLKCRGDDDVMGLEAVDVGGATQVPCWGKALGNSVDGMDLGWRLSGGRGGECDVKRLEDRRVEERLAVGMQCPFSVRPS